MKCLHVSSRTALWHSATTAAALCTALLERAGKGVGYCTRRVELVQLCFCYIMTRPYRTQMHVHISYVLALHIASLHYCILALLHAAGRSLLNHGVWVVAVCATYYIVPIHVIGLHV